MYHKLGYVQAMSNLSSASAWCNEYKPCLVPKGEATTEIYTEYDLPRKLAQPHDVILDAKGAIWYSAFGDQKLGRVDPASGAVKEYDIAVSKPEYPIGVLALRGDREGKLWLGNMYQAAIIKFDPASEQFQYFKPPPE